MHQDRFPLWLNWHLKQQERLSYHATANAQLSAILNAGNGISVIATDMNGVITLFNAGAEAVLGYSAEEMVGKATPESFHLASEVEGHGQRLSEQYGREIRGFDVFVQKGHRVSAAPGSDR